MAKKIDGYIKLQVPAGTANPSPPIGPALGQRGVNIMEFCKAFNAATDGLEKGMPIPPPPEDVAARKFPVAKKVRSVRGSRPPPWSQTGGRGRGRGRGGNGRGRGGHNNSNNNNKDWKKNKKN